MNTSDYASLWLRASQADKSTYPVKEEAGYLVANLAYLFDVNPSAVALCPSTRCPFSGWAVGRLIGAKLDPILLVYSVVKVLGFSWWYLCIFFGLPMYHRIRDVVNAQFIKSVSCSGKKTINLAFLQISIFMYLTLIMFYGIINVMIYIMIFTAIRTKPLCQTNL